MAIDGASHCTLWKRSNKLLAAPLTLCLHLAFLADSHEFLAVLAVPLLPRLSAMPLSRVTLADPAPLIRIWLTGERINSFRMVLPLMIRPQKAFRIFWLITVRSMVSMVDMMLWRNWSVKECPYIAMQFSTPGCEVALVSVPTVYAALEFLRVRVDDGDFHCS